MTGALVAGLLAGWAVAVPVGPVAACLVTLAASAPWRTAVAAALGVAVADGAYALVAVLGGAAVAPLLAPVAAPLRWVSAAVLLGLALHTAAGAVRRGGAEVAPAPGRAFVRLLWLTLVNPMTVVAFAAVVLGAGGHGGWSGVERVVFVAGAVTASALWQLLLAGGGALLGRAVLGGQGRRWTALGSSAVMAVLALDVVRG